MSNPNLGIPSFSTHIHNEDVDAFLAAYITCLVQEYQLDIPLDSDTTVLERHWERILARYNQQFTDIFCRKLSQAWEALLLTCDTQSASLPMDLFRAAALPEVYLTPELKDKQASNITTEFDRPRDSPFTGDPLTTPQISDTYQQRRDAAATRLPELDALKVQYNDAFKKRDSVAWLTHHLTFARYDAQKPIPKSTVPANIRQNWEEIIAAAFNTIAPDTFLKTITNDWFYLVNQAGIPTTIDDIESILVLYIAKQKKETRTQSSKPGLLKRLFS